MKKIPLILFSLLLIALNACKKSDDVKTITFEGKSFEKKWAVKDLNPDLPADWSSSGFLTLDFRASSTQRFHISLYDTGGVRRLRILPFQGAWVRASIPLANFKKRNVIGHDMAAIGQKGMPGYGLGFSGNVGTINQVDSIGFLMDQPIGSPVLEIRDLRLTMTPEDSVLNPVPLVDEYGQWYPAE